MKDFGKELTWAGVSALAHGEEVVLVAALPVVDERDALTVVRVVVEPVRNDSLHRRTGPESFRSEKGPERMMETKNSDVSSSDVPGEVLGAGAGGEWDGAGVCGARTAERRLRPRTDVAPEVHRTVLLQS